MKTVLISIRPQWCELIASGKKTIEVRKTRPKLETPFKCYIYETKGKTDVPTFIDEEGHYIYEGRGQVIGEFVCDEIMSGRNLGGEEFSLPWGECEDCLSDGEIEAYGKNASYLYGWHISDLVIYDKPKELSEFVRPRSCPYGFDCEVCKKPHACSIRPPQSWCYVEEVSE